MACSQVGQRPQMGCLICKCLICRLDSISRLDGTQAHLSNLWLGRQHSSKWRGWFSSEIRSWQGRREHHDRVNYCVSAKNWFVQALCMILLEYKNWIKTNFIHFAPTSTSVPKYKFRPNINDRKLKLLNRCSFSQNEVPYCRFMNWSHKYERSEYAQRLHAGYDQFYLMMTSCRNVVNNWLDVFHFCCAEE